MVANGPLDAGKKVSDDDGDTNAVVRGKRGDEEGSTGDGLDPGDGVDPAEGLVNYSTEEFSVEEERGHFRGPVVDVGIVRI
eukprot:g27414.t1